LYADDIVLLSESKSGLQSSLNILGIYCSNWKLQVNVEKSKVLIFNSNGKTPVNEFSYNNNIIQTVSTYYYLGVMLKCNGNFNIAVSLLMEKARKAYFKIKKIIGLNNPFKLLEKLFEIFRLDCKPDLLSDNNTISSAYNNQFTERSPTLTGSQLPVTKSLTISSIQFLKRVG
jgi:hypothetical protein